MKGAVVRLKGEPNPHGFWIKGEDGNEYYSHLGDLQKNEEKLYDNLSRPTQCLSIGDNVEFNIFEPNLPRAINVKKHE